MIRGGAGSASASARTTRSMTTGQFGSSWTREAVPATTPRCRSLTHPPPTASSVGVDPPSKRRVARGLLSWSIRVTSPGHPASPRSAHQTMFLWARILPRLGPVVDPRNRGSTRTSGTSPCSVHAHRPQDQSPLLLPVRRASTGSASWPQQSREGHGRRHGRL